MKIKTIIFLVVVALLAWYFVFPTLEVIEENDPSPISTDLAEDPFGHMDQETMNEFSEEMEKMKDKEIVASESMPPSEVRKQGEFKANAHNVNGRALLIETGVENVLRFEDFETINGPNLHIYLSADFKGKDFIDLGKIKATKGNINYQLDDDINTDKYNKVLVWCVPFKVLFSYAELN